jgi:membrane protein DedA with SNARE-associated domain
MSSFVTHYGLGVLFLVVMLESFGVPLPGETALIAAGILAAQGHLSIVAVIVVGAAAAILGDNLGYWIIGRWGGRALFAHWGWLNRYADRVLPRAERVVARHGAKAVFFGRFVAVLRYTVAWLAGLGRMPWRSFLLWNALGGIAWATLVSLLAYYLGAAAAATIARYGLYGAALVIVIVVAGYFGMRALRRRAEGRL